MITTENDERLRLDRESTLETDLDLEAIGSEDEDYESAPPSYQITTYPADFTLEVLATKWKADNTGEIRIPPFQRGFVWRQVQASKLIESFLVGLPVPAVFLYKERDSQDFLVIDGQQRLKTVFYFFEGFFGGEADGSRKVFRLVGLSPQSPYINKTFEELSEIDQKTLRNSVLRAFIVQQLNPDDATSMYHIFERLNTGGTLLTNQEIRHCVYHGTLIPLLGELNGLCQWREILGKPKPDSRRKDIELIVRFLALRDPQHYEKPMKDFLSKFMRKNRSPNAAVILNTQQLFQRTCASVREKLGAKPFHVRAGLNAAVFDSVFVAFSKHLDAIPEDSQARYQKLLSDVTFSECTQAATTDVDSVLTRLERAETVLFA